VAVEAYLASILPGRGWELIALQLYDHLHAKHPQLPLTLQLLLHSGGSVQLLAPVVAHIDRRKSYKLLNNSAIENIFEAIIVADRSWKILVLPREISQRAESFKN
jgi:hypothetical protein